MSGREAAAPVTGGPGGVRTPAAARPPLAGLAAVLLAAALAAAPGACAVATSSGGGESTGARADEASVPAPPSAPALRSGEAARAELVVLLVGSREAGPRGEARFLRVEALAATGAALPLELQTTRITTVALAGRQVPLASGRLPEGLYDGLRLVVAGAAPAADAEVPVDLPGQFRLLEGEARTLEIHWDLTRAFGDDGGVEPSSFDLRAVADTPTRLILYVTDEISGRVAAVNRETGRAFAFIPVGDRPRGIAFSPDGRRVFVANAGDDTVSVIDALRQTVTDTLFLKPGSAPEDLVAVLDGRRLAVSCPGTRRVAFLDTLSNATVAEAEAPRPPGRMAAGRDGRTVYVLMPEGSQVLALDASRGTIAGGPVQVEAEPADLAVDPVSGRIYVTHGRAPLISVLTENLRFDRRLQVGSFNEGIVVEPTGGRLYFGGGEAGGLVAVNAEVGTTVQRIAAPAAHRLALDPQGRRIFATGGRGGRLFIVDRIAGKLEGEVSVGAHATDLAVAP